MNQQGKNKTTKTLPAARLPPLLHPQAGNAAAIVAGLSFMFICMILPLVGQAGAAMPFAGKNFVFFLACLLGSLLLAAVAVVLKTLRSRADGSPRPWISWGLLVVHIGLLLALLTGLLKI